MCSQSLLWAMARSCRPAQSTFNRQVKGHIVLKTLSAVRTSDFLSAVLRNKSGGMLRGILIKTPLLAAPCGRALQLAHSVFEV